MSDASIRVCVVRSHGVIAPLVMDCYERAFRKMGMETRVLDTVKHGLSQATFGAELNAIMAWMPNMAIGYGSTGLFDNGFFRNIGVPLAMLFYDSPFVTPWPVLQGLVKEISAFPEAYHCFVWDRAYRAPVEAMGVRNVHPIMLAADPSIFGPRTPAYRFDVSFVGRMGNPEQLRRERRSQWPAETNEFADRLIQRKIASPSTPLSRLWNELAGEGFPALRLDWGQPDIGALHLAIHVEGSALLRQALLAAIRTVKPDVFGSDWSLPGISVHPEVDYVRELPAVYSDSRINLNVSSLQLDHAVNNRVFDVAAAGGFLLTDHRDDLGLIMPGCEPMTYHSGEELDAKVAYFLAHESERRELAAALQKAVLRAHTYEHRVVQVLKAMTGKS